MQAFIVRPFGIKAGINFDEVHTRLIQPALENVQIMGITTGAVVSAGNIREDMFALLMTSDLVIADISIHNANVFYELGIRHALRDKHTILIRCDKDTVPFDLKTDRYFKYDVNNLKASITGLSEVITATIQQATADSPVFKMLPQLEAQNPETFLAMPDSFKQELGVAQKAKDYGKLGLLAYEASYFPWSIPALRNIGEIQYKGNRHIEAREIWEEILKKKPGDIEAYDRLATIYQRLASATSKFNRNMAEELFAKSEEAITFLLNTVGKLAPAKIAEVYALQGRNEKTRWLEQWTTQKANEKVSFALRSNYLISAFESYYTGFSKDLNHSFSGINALALLKIIIALAEKKPEVWKAKFASENDAKYKLDTYLEYFDILKAVIQKGINDQLQQQQGLQKKDAWVAMTRAHVAFLTDANLERLTNLYFEATEIGGPLHKDSERRQLQIFEKLNINPESVTAALDILGNTAQVLEQKTQHVILFTGHMVDEENRSEPRFPKENAEKVKAKIVAKIKEILIQLELQKESKMMVDGILGIAGGACGGDLLFHEACHELGIATKVFLALPKTKFIETSVQRGGNEWIHRFNKLYGNETLFVELTNNAALPNWLAINDFNYDFWTRNNQWILHNAVALTTGVLNFIAVWDGKKGDGPGGTEDMIKAVKNYGASTYIIEPMV